MSSITATPMGFGPLLRQWRTARRMSQQQLAIESEVSTRHISYVENGKSSPSREMVLILASALDLPLRERNSLLSTAGFAPVYRETSESRRLLDALLAYPGVPSRMREVDLSEAPRVCITVNLEKDGTRLDRFSTLTTLGTPLDVTAQELRIESYFPADEATGEWLRKSAASAAN